MCTAAFSESFHAFWSFSLTHALIFPFIQHNNEQRTSTWAARGTTHVAARSTCWIFTTTRAPPPVAIMPSHVVLCAEWWRWVVKVVDVVEVEMIGGWLATYIFILSLMGIHKLYTCMMVWYIGLACIYLDRSKRYNSCSQHIIACTQWCTLDILLCSTLYFSVEHVRNEFVLFMQFFKTWNSKIFGWCRRN